MTSKRGRYRAGEQTRVQLIETAERLFALSGYEGVSISEIRIAAGQQNASVIAYYFGSKENLLHAIFAYRLPDINADRQAMMLRTSSQGANMTTREALWAIVQPLANSIGPDNHYVALLDRLMETEILGRVFTTADPTVTTSGSAVNQSLNDSLVELAEDVRLQRIQIVYTSYLRVLAGYDRRGTRPTHAELSALIDGWEALLRAPVSQETLDAQKEAQLNPTSSSH